MVNALLNAAAICLTLWGATLVYLAHPNQLLRRQPLSRAAGGGGALLCALALAGLVARHGAGVGISVALCLWMLVGTALPYLAVWRAAHRPEPQRMTTAQGLARAEARPDTTSGVAE